MFKSSFNPIVSAPICLSSSMVAHQGSIPCSGAGGIEFKECDYDDDLPANSSSSTTSEEQNEEEESPLSSPIMEMGIATTQKARDHHPLKDTDKSINHKDGAIENSFHHDSS